MDAWHIWLIVTIFFMIIEIFVPSFLAASIAIGCFRAGAGAFFNGDLKLQMILLICGIIVSLFGCGRLCLGMNTGDRSISKPMQKCLSAKEAPFQSELTTA